MKEEQRQQGGKSNREIGRKREEMKNPSRDKKRKNEKRKRRDK